MPAQRPARAHRCAVGRNRITNHSWYRDRWFRTLPGSSSGSCAAGGEWIDRPRRGKPRGGMPAERCTSMRTKTAWSSCEAAWSRKWARCSCRRWPPRARYSTSGPAETRRRRPRRKGLVIPASDTPSRAQQQADALGLLAETALHHELDPGAPGERYQVVVHVDAAVLASPEQPGQSVLEEGSHVSGETSRRLACDASRVVMRHDEEGQLLEIGARTRTIPPALRRALQHRDRGCCFPGCGPVGQGHHLRHWVHGGPTTLSNLALLCRRHHRAVHEEGYQVARGLDGALQFRRPDGHPVPEVPPSASVPADPVGALRARHDAEGLRVHARTACPGWLGERLDVGWACIPWPRAKRRWPGLVNHRDRGAAGPFPAKAAECPGQSVSLVLPSVSTSIESGT